MSNVIIQAKDKLVKVLSNIDRIIKDEAIDQTKFISQLNRDQLLLGQKGDGSAMPNYVEESVQPSAPGKITLRDKGPFHEGIEPMFFDGGFDMVGTDRKTPFLVSKFGNILDLTDESKQKLRERMIPGIIKRIKLR